MQKNAFFRILRGEYAN